MTRIFEWHTNFYTCFNEKNCSNFYFHRTIYRGIHTVLNRSQVQPVHSHLAQNRPQVQPVHSHLAQNPPIFLQPAGKNRLKMGEVWFEHRTSNSHHEETADHWDNASRLSSTTAYKLYSQFLFFFWFNQNHRFLTKKPNPIRLAVWLTGTENREIELSVRFSVRFCTGWGSAEQVSRIYGKDLKCWHAYFCGLAEQVSACRLESKMKSSN